MELDYVDKLPLEMRVVCDPEAFELPGLGAVPPDVATLFLPRPWRAAIACVDLLSGRACNVSCTSVPTGGSGSHYLRARPGAILPAVMASLSKRQHQGSDRV